MSKTTGIIFQTLIIAPLYFGIFGCNSTPTKPLASVDFYAPHRQDDPILSHPQAQKLAEPIPPRTVKHIAPVPPKTVATTSPATTQVSSNGEFMTLGGIVAVVNGKPIYASRVLNEIRSVLKANAVEMDRNEFEKSARQEIIKRMYDDVRSELLVALARRRLDDKDRQLAERLTEKWRQDQITQAGGSVEAARRSAAECARRYNASITNPFIPPAPEDIEFEPLVEEVHWRYLVELFSYRKVFSRVDVSAAEMRGYYARNVDRKFTEHSRAQFRLIQIDPDVVGGRDAAATRIGSILRRALAGEDFARLARENDSDPRLAAKAGLIDWIERGAYRLEKVEKAVWETPVGQITKDPIEDNGSYFIAKVEAKTDGRVRPFDELKTQQEISGAMRYSQIKELFDSFTEDLDEEARRAASKEEKGISGDDTTLNTAIEMAMQMYAQWHKDKPLPTLGQATP